MLRQRSCVLWRNRTLLRCIFGSDVNKDLGPKVKDFIPKAKAKAKNLVPESTDPHQA